MNVEHDITLHVLRLCFEGGKLANLTHTCIFQSRTTGFLHKKTLACLFVPGRFHKNTLECTSRKVDTPLCIAEFRCRDACDKNQMEETKAENKDPENGA